MFDSYPLCAARAFESASGRARLFDLASRMWSRCFGFRSVTAIAVLVVASLSGCATSGSTATTSSGPRNALSDTEIREHSDLVVLVAIKRLRPQWLRARGGGSPVVVVDGAKYSYQMMNQIRVGETSSIAYMSPADATTRYGTGFKDGAIVIRRRATGGTGL